MSEVICVTQSANTEHPFNSVCFYFNSEFNSKSVYLDQNSIQDVSKMGAKTIITDNLQILPMSKQSKVILYICEENMFVEANQALRRQMHVYKDVDIFCASAWLARILYRNYQIKAKIQYPYVKYREENAEAIMLICNEYNDVIRTVEDETGEDVQIYKDLDDFSIAKLYIHIPSQDESANIRIPTAGSWGVPTVTIDRGCISELITQGDLLLAQDTNNKQWVRGIKNSIKDHAENSKMAKEQSKKYSNLDAIVEKAKLLAHKRAFAKFGKMPQPELDALLQRKKSQIVKKQPRNVPPRMVERPPSPSKIKYVYTKNDYLTPTEYIKQVPNWFSQSRWASGNIDVSIIIPMFRSNEAIQQQIRNWDVMQDGLAKEIIYVEDGCPEDSAQSAIYAWDQFRNTWNNLQSIYGTEFKEHIGKIISLSNNSGYATACNVGAKHASGKYLIFLNADTIVTPNWIKPIIDVFAEHDKVGIVGNMHLKQDGTIDSAGSEWLWETRIFEHIGRNTYHGKRLTNVMRYTEAPQDLLKVAEREMVTGCCFGITKHLFDQVGGFDIGYRIGYWEDSDLNMKVQEEGYKIYFQPDSVIYHKVGHAEAGAHPYMIDNAQRFYEKWVDTHKIDSFVKTIRPPGHI